MPPRIWSDPYSLSMTLSCLKAGFMPGRPQRVQPLCGASASPKTSNSLTEILILLIKIIAGWLKEGWPILQPQKVGCRYQTSLRTMTTSSKPLFDSKWPVYTRYTISQMAINNVANTLTRDNDRTEDELTQILHSHRPSQLPKHFEIVPLPNGIVSWLFLLLLLLPVK